MAIHWTISHPERLVVVTVDGKFEPENFVRYIADLRASGALPYRKLIDLKFLAHTPSVAEVRAMSRIVADYARSNPFGPVAVVIDCDVAYELTAIFDARTNIARPLGIFRQIADATGWLDRQAPTPVAAV